jgi:hypothetical protein
VLYEAWADAGLRERWLRGAKLAVRKATPRKSMRITWQPGPGATSVEVNFYSKGDGKSMVQVGHTKIPTAAAGQKWKKFWGERLADLKKMLEP